MIHSLPAVGCDIFSDVRDLMLAVLSGAAGVECRLVFQKKDFSQQAQADEPATVALLAKCVLKGVVLQVASTD